MNKQRGEKGGQMFWDKEYAQNDHLAISAAPSEDFLKFIHFLEQEFKKKFLNPLASTTDLGCGNGRNLLYLSKTYGMRGTGFDISNEAVAQANERAKQLGVPVVCSVQSIAEPIPLADNSQTIVLDMMTSHFLNKEERVALRNEIVRILKPDGFLFFKTFLRDGDQHAERLLRESPGNEEGTYIHPRIGVAEHVFTIKEIEELLGDDFYIHKVTKSHGHMRSAAKRRSVSVIAQKIER